MDSTRVVVIKDPTPDATVEPVHVIFKGSRENTYTPNVSTSYSNTSIQFSAPPPSPTTVIDRNIYLGIPIELNFTGDTGNDDIGLLDDYGNGCAFRAFPLQSIIQTTTVTINNTSISYNTNDLFPYLLRLSTCAKEDAAYYSQTTTMQDQSQDYAELLGSMINPLGGYPGASLQEQMKRGEFPIIVVNNTRTAATLRAFLVEPLFMAPFLFKNEHEPGFYGVQNLVFNFTLGDLTRVWSKAINPPFNYTTITATIAGVSLPGVNQNAPTLFFRYCTPNIEPPLEAPHYSPYYDVQRYPTEVGVLAAGATATIQSNNIQLNGIPKRMIVFARRRNTDRTHLTTDTFSYLENISINFRNRSGLLSSASPRELWLMAQKNGYKCSWPQWTGRPGNGTVSSIGSMIVIDFGDDIGLLPEEAPGIAGTMQLQFRVDVRNIAFNPINFTLYTVIITDGMFYTQGNMAATSINDVTPEMVMASSAAPFKNYKRDSYYGGFLGAIKPYAKLAAKGYQTIYPWLIKGANKLNQAAEWVSGLGYGYGAMDDDVYGSGFAEDKPSKKRRMKGGALLSLDDLRYQREKNY